MALKDIEIRASPGKFFKFPANKAVKFDSIQNPLQGRKGKSGMKK